MIACVVDCVDCPYYVVRFFSGVDKGQANFAEPQVELAQDRVSEGFSRDAGAVGDYENGAGGSGVQLLVWHGFIASELHIG